MTDWREPFADESRVSWERKVAETAGLLWPLARPYVDAWRYDSRLPEARQLEDHFRGLEAVPSLHADAIDGVAEAVRSLLRSAALVRLDLFRGQPAETHWARATKSSWMDEDSPRGHRSGRWRWATPPGGFRVPFWLPTCPSGRWPWLSIPAPMPR